MTNQEEANEDAKYSHSAQRPQETDQEAVVLNKNFYSDLYDIDQPV